MRVADFTGHDSIRAMAEAVLSGAPPRFALAGLSMGGYVAQEIMRLAPERVLRLALLDTSARTDGEDYLSRRRGLLELARKGKFKGVTPALLPMLIHPSRLDDRALIEAITAMAARVGQPAFICQQTAIIGRLDGRAGAVDVQRVCSRKRCDHRAPDLLYDGAHALEVVVGGHGKACLDYVHAKLVELVRQPELFGRGHRGPGRLFAIPQRGIENRDLGHIVPILLRVLCQIKTGPSLLRGPARRRVQSRSVRLCRFPETDALSPQE